MYILKFIDGFWHYKSTFDIHCSNLCTTLPGSFMQRAKQALFSFNIWPWHTIQLSFCSFMADGSHQVKFNLHNMFRSRMKAKKRRVFFLGDISYLWLWYISFTFFFFFSLTHTRRVLNFSSLHFPSSSYNTYSCSCPLKYIQRRKQQYTV